MIANGVKVPENFFTLKLIKGKTNYRLLDSDFENEPSAEDYVKWRVTDLKETSLSVKVNFKNPASISNDHSSPDKIRLVTENTDWLRS